jgi:23S rRNA (adenine2503-C2)-methyltransferase
MTKLIEPQMLSCVGRDDLALVYVLQFDGDHQLVVETVDSIDPRYPRREKSVIIISTQFGCPMGCLMCDAGVAFHGNLSSEQLLAQVRFVLARRPEVLATRKLKVHFSRMGEPALNPAVLEALARLPELLPAPGLIPCIATVAPRGCQPFLTRLLELKRRLYDQGRFQMQLSINSTDAEARRRLIPGPLLSLEEIAALAPAFHGPGDRRVVLNFALSPGCPVDVGRLAAIFDPEHFMIKLTPVNPTEAARESGLSTVLSAATPEGAAELVSRCEAAGFETVVSIGEADEILIGSNCGQVVRTRDSRWTPPLPAKKTTTPLADPGC